MPSIAETRLTDGLTERLDVFKKNRQDQLKRITTCIEEPSIAAQKLPFIDARILCKLSAAIRFDMHDADNTIELIEQLNEGHRPSDLGQRIQALSKRKVLFEDNEILRKLEGSK